MERFIFTLVFITLSSISFTSGREVCCSNGDCYDDSPPFDSIIYPLPTCPEEMEPLFLLFTRDNEEHPEEFDRYTVPTHFNGTRKTVFVVHGFNNDHTKGWLERTRKALLKRDNVNVVIVGWGKGATMSNYFKAVSNTRVAATEIAHVMQNLYRVGTNPAMMWCVGHSLGAHACGRAGKISKFGRITGLDPAGPAWDDLAFSAGLTKDDADFVDNIHTHGQQLIPMGSMKPRGHVDFYPNDGGLQPGCVTYAINGIFNSMSELARRGIPKVNQRFHDLKGLASSFGWANCSHSRSKYYFIESVAGPCFRATSTCTDAGDIPGSCKACRDGTCPYMGYDTPSTALHGLYNLATRSSEPWCHQ